MRDIRDANERRLQESDTEYAFAVLSDDRISNFIPSTTGVPSRVIMNKRMRNFMHVRLASKFI